MRALIILLFFVQLCHSQTTCFDIVLNGYNISSVTDDSQFIWVGTFDSGLISIHKTTNDIQIYTIDNSNISSNAIKSVLNIDNRLYVSSELSLMQFLNGSFQELSTTIQGTMTSTANGSLAIAAPYEFNILNANNQIIYTKDLLTLVTPSCCGMTTSMEYDVSGRLWLSNYAFYEYDILTYNGIHWNVYDINNSILPVESPNFLNGITTHDDLIFASNWNGLFKFENNLWTEEHSESNPSVFNDTESIDGLLVNAIKFDSQGVLWIGAGDYDNTNSGKIAFKAEDDWGFLDNNSELLPGVNFFEESQYDLDTIYAASNNGIIIINANCLLLSTEDYEESNEVLVFPNPTKGVLNINLKKAKPFSFQLINSLGQVILYERDFLYDSIDVSRLASGVYNLVIELDQGIVNKKILKFNE